MHLVNGTALHINQCIVGKHSRMISKKYHHKGNSILSYFHCLFSFHFSSSLEIYSCAKKKDTEEQFYELPHMHSEGVKVFFSVAFPFFLCICSFMAYVWVVPLLFLVVLHYFILFFCSTWISVFFCCGTVAIALHFFFFFDFRLQFNIVIMRWMLSAGIRTHGSVS